MSEMRCTRLAGNTGRKNDAKNRRLRAIAQLCGMYFRNQGMNRQSERLVKQQHLLHMSPQYGELRPTSG